MNSAQRRKSIVNEWQSKQPQDEKESLKSELCGIEKENTVSRAMALGEQFKKFEKRKK